MHSAAYVMHRTHRTCLNIPRNIRSEKISLAIIAKFIAMNRAYPRIYLYLRTSTREIHIKGPKITLYFIQKHHRCAFNRYHPVYPVSPN